jgi:hypothetical protein
MYLKGRAQKPSKTYVNLLPEGSQPRLRKHRQGQQCSSNFVADVDPAQIAPANCESQDMPWRLLG